MRIAMTKLHLSANETVARFVYNLATMRPNFTEFSESVNFYTLGQQWNALSSDVRNQQRDDAVAQLKASNVSM